MNTVYLSLGSNEGNRIQWLKKAIALLEHHSGPVTRQSAVYETAAWGLTDQPAFLNMAVELQTSKTPAELLAENQQIETALGRQRHIKWGPRTLDIDILLYNSEIINTPALVIPHPFLHERRFTLIPLAEIAPDYMHPLLHASISTLLLRCPDKLDVSKYANTR